LWQGAARAIATRRSLNGRLTPSGLPVRQFLESMFERAWWTLKKYLGMPINAGAKIMFQGTDTLRPFTSGP
jgi:hypothetical protein